MMIFDDLSGFMMIFDDLSGFMIIYNVIYDDL
jgi:hypothetical protein